MLIRHKSYNNTDVPFIRLNLNNFGMADVLHERNEQFVHSYSDMPEIRRAFSRNF